MFQSHDKKFTNTSEIYLAKISTLHDILNIRNIIISYYIILHNLYVVLSFMKIDKYNKFGNIFYLTKDKTFKDKKNNG